MKMASVPVVILAIALASYALWFGSAMRGGAALVGRVRNYLWLAYLASAVLALFWILFLNGQIGRGAGGHPPGALIGYLLAAEVVLCFVVAALLILLSYAAQWMASR